MFLIPKSMRPSVVHKIAADYRMGVPLLVRASGLLGLAAIVLGIFLMIQDGISVGGVAAIVAGIVLLFPLLMIWSILRNFKGFRYHLRDAIVMGVDWRGDEHVLDVGVGSGLTLFGCAQKLTNGRAVGIDLFLDDSGGGTAETFWKNAAHEGLKDRVELEIADARDMPFADSSFDVIVSTSALHHVLGGSEARRQVAREMVRVLKPGGRLLVFDLAPMLVELEAAMRDAGFVDMRRAGGDSALIRGDKPA
jgi:SAM-dependent methyltransferase